MSVLQKIQLIRLPEDQYIRTATNKKQIFLHHTAGNSNAAGVVEYWARTPERIATSFIIGGQPPRGITAWKDGQIVQCYSSQYWGYHLGIPSRSRPPGSRPSKQIEQESIGIEICNWGWLRQRPDGKFINYVGGVMNDSEVFDLQYKYRGYRYWHNYTDAQIDSVRELLLFLCNRWNIPTQFVGTSMFEINARAFRGQPGIWSHTSVRRDKTDIYPHPKIISMLSSL